MWEAVAWRRSSCLPAVKFQCRDTKPLVFSCRMFMSVKFTQTSQHINCIIIFSEELECMMTMVNCRYSVNLCVSLISLGELVTTPLFDGTESYIAYPPLTNIHDDLRIELEFKPLENNGLMFFSGGKKMKVEDFVAISMVEGHVEFRYELGTGEVNLQCCVSKGPQFLSLELEFGSSSISFS